MKPYLPSLNLNPFHSFIDFHSPYPKDYICNVNKLKVEYSMNLQYHWHPRRCWNSGPISVHVKALEAKLINE